MMGDGVEVEVVVWNERLSFLEAVFSFVRLEFLIFFFSFHFLFLCFFLPGRVSRKVLGFFITTYLCETIVDL